MRITNVPSLILSLALQVLPISRTFLVTTPVTGSSFAVISAWIVGAVALLGSYDSVSGASTTITSPRTATATNGTPFSYRITTGPDAANTFNAAPLPSGLTVSTTVGRITGTPTVNGVFVILLTASDSGRPSRTVTKNLTLTILPNDKNAPPSITTQPTNRTATNGGVATFSVGAWGSGPLRYAWFSGGRRISGATNATLTMTPVTTNDAGSYWVVVTNHFGSVTSTTVTLTVVPDTTRPRLTVLSPNAAFTRVVSNSFTFSGTAQDDQGVARVEVQHGTNGFAAATGTNNWTARVPLDPGTNVFQVRAIDTSANLSVTNTKTIFFAVLAPCSLTTNGSGAVAGLTNNQMLELGQSYTLKATPAPGNLFSNWNIGGQAVAGPVLTFKMSSNLTVAANFVPNPFPGLKGSYSGLFHPPTGDLPHEQSGYFTLAVTDKGTYTGKLLLNGGAFSISGSFGLDLSAQKTVPRKGTNEVFVGLQLTSNLDEVTGYVSNLWWTSDLFGYRAGFNASTHPAAGQLGPYTMLLSGSDDPAAAPFGLGSASLSVASSGAVTLKGTLADGTAITQKGALAANGQLPLYAKLYNGKGSLFGWLTFTNTATNDIPGLLLWTKKEGILGNYYPRGFTNEVRTLASRYTAPAAGIPLLGFSNSLVILDGGNFPDPATNDVFLSSLNKITVTSADTNKLALAVTASSGLLSGSFFHPQTLKKSTIKGTVLQKQDLGGAFFLGTNQSGRVFLGPPDHSPVFNP